MALQTSSFACYMRPHSGPFLAYYMGAPSDQFLSIEYGGLLRSVSSLIMEASLCLFSYYMGAPRIISLHTILGPPNHFLRFLYGAPEIRFFSYNMGAPLRSVSLFTICPPPSDQFLCMLYGGHLRF